MYIKYMLEVAMLQDVEIVSIDPAPFMVPKLDDVVSEKPQIQTGMPFPDEPEPNADGVNTSVHPMVYKLLGAIFFAILGAFYWAFSGNGETVFAIGICLAYCTMYFATPIALAKATPGRKKTKQSYTDFLHRPFQTWTGRINGQEAMAQILLIPIALLVCCVGIAVIIVNARVV